MATKNPFQGDDKDPFSAVRDKDGGIKKQTFGQAFAAARRAGKKTFTHNGKSFTTETKEDVERRSAAKKRDDADFAKEEARSKTARAVAGDSDNRRARDFQMPSELGRPGPTRARALYGKRDEMKTRSMASQKSKAKENKEMRDQERGRLKKDIDTASAKRKVSGFAAGGKVSARADGCATKGKTKGRMV